MSSFGGRLKKTIDNSGLTRDCFSEKCGISRGQLYKYFNDDQKPGTPFLQKICEEFPEIDIKWLLVGEETFSKADHLLKKHISDLGSFVDNFEKYLYIFKDFVLQTSTAEQFDLLTKGFPDTKNMMVKLTDYHSELQSYISDLKEYKSDLKKIDFKQPDDEAWNLLQVKGIQFEFKIASLLVFQAMNETEYSLEENEREKLSRYIGRQKIAEVFYSIKDHLLMLKGVANEKRRKT